jgi:hypothetical protein
MSPWKPLALGWAAYGFEVLNPRWGQNKVTNEDGETIMSGNNSVAWMTFIAGGNTNGVFGTYFPPTIRAKLKNGATTIQNYAIQDYVDLSDVQGNPLVCKASVPCHRYLLAAKERLQATPGSGSTSAHATETTRTQTPQAGAEEPETAADAAPDAMISRNSSGNATPTKNATRKTKPALRRTLGPQPVSLQTPG